MGLLSKIKNAVLGNPADAPIKAAGLKRSSRWPTVRAAHLVENPSCAVCGAKKELNVHHKKPFHLHPELELERSNLITLCDEGARNCHLLFGHLLDFSASNPDVDVDAAAMRAKIQGREKRHT